MTAKTLLAHIRRTPMARGGTLVESKRLLCHRIANAIEDHDVYPRLASRIARQLVIKCHEEDLLVPGIWSELGALLRRDVVRLQQHPGLVERQIVVALPKLSAAQIETLLAELRTEDATIARTVLNTALDAAEPVTAAHRYLKQFHDIAAQLRRIVPDIARTFANGAFMARVPLQTALDHFSRFRDVMKQVRGDVRFARMVAREACRAPDPVAAAERCITDYRQIVDTLSTHGIETGIARSIAGMASIAADPTKTADTLLKRFDIVLNHVHATHPVVARSIALAACRASDPVQAADLYMKNYDTIVRVVRRTDPRLAHSVASQAFRSDKPLVWAKRYLKKLQQAD